MQGNTIRGVETVILDSEEGPVTAVQLAVDCYDLSQAEPFMSEVAEVFLMQRMISPPETSGLLITLEGRMDLREFGMLWRMVSAEKPAVGAFMAEMDMADVVSFNSDGQPMGLSLLPRR